MKVCLQFLLMALFAVSLICCGKKTETDALGNPIEPTESATTQTPEELGKALFEGKGTCATCHQAKAKVIGPSITAISKIYNVKKASIALFLKGEGEPLVDPSQYEIMKANFAITKSMTDEELDALETYMLSVK